MSYYHLLTDRCVISRRTGTTDDAFATPTFGPKETIRCAYQESDQKVRDIKGNERIAAHTIMTKHKVSDGDRVWLPVNVDAGAVPNSDNDGDALIPISQRNDRSRRGGFRAYVTFF